MIKLTNSPRRRTGSKISNIDNRGDCNIKFKSNFETGYTPLLKLFPVITNNSVDFFNTSNNVYSSNSVCNLINMTNVYDVFYNRSVNRSSRTFHEWYVVTSMLSVIGVRNNLKTLFSCLTTTPNYKSQYTHVSNDVDVLALAVIKNEDINHIEFLEKNEFNIPKDKIKILISQNKFKTVKFIRAFYSGVLRLHVLRQFKDLGIEVEVVSDEELAKYYDKPYTLQTNSFSKIAEYDKEIKEKVIPNIYKHLVI